MTQINIYSALCVTAQAALDVKSLMCGHAPSVNDPHKICFCCRINPVHSLPKLHICQTTLNGELGDVLSAVSASQHLQCYVNPGSQSHLHVSFAAVASSCHCQYRLQQLGVL